MTRDIPKAGWTEFLDEFSRTHQAWLATVDSVEPDRQVDTRAVEQPLRSVSPEVQANQVVSVSIRFQEDSGSRPAIEVAAPIALRVDETAEGAARGVEILDREGRCTRIRFRAAPRGDILDGVAPGELPPR